MISLDENKAYTLGIPMDNQRTTNGPHRIGKDRIGKDRLGEEREDITPLVAAPPSSP